MGAIAPALADKLYQHQIKNNLSQSDILIDDRMDIIERWNNAGGTGIHYESASQVLSDLKKLGL